MTKFSFAFAALCLVLAPRARASVNGSITSPVFSYTFASSPGKDQFDFSGSYALGSGSDGTHLPGDAVLISFDNGRFLQVIPSGSFSSISGGYRYTAPSTTSGVTQMKWMTNSTFLLNVRNIDMTGTNPTRFGTISITVGDDVFTYVPNSLARAKITGPATGTVGALVSLSGDQSSDFGGGSPLTYAWTVVSQPLGSNVTLSSTNQVTTSFTPSKNGRYVVKLLNNDGIADGIPALFTVVASGGAAMPPPAPGPSNGVATLSTNSPSYVVGDSATLTLHEDAQPGNGTSRWFFRATLNDAPITLTAVPNSNNDSYTTAPFTAAGSQAFKVDTFLENTNLAKALAAQITALNADISAINDALQYETSADVIAQLQAQKAVDMDQIANANDQIDQNRTKVGDTLVLSFSVN